ncbi:MAG: D-2-hydroxyacid dehydrogenase [Thermoplasmatota archaeon]
MEGPTKLVIGKRLDRRHIEMIRTRSPGLEISTCEIPEEQEKMLEGADILFSRMLPRSPSRYPSLKWVQFMWEGIDSMTEDLRSSDVIVTNASGIHSIQIAEHVFMYILVHSRKAFRYREDQMRGYWLPWSDQPLLETLSGKTIGVIGYGSIGRSVARIAKGFGMRVLALKRDIGSTGRLQYPDIGYDERSAGMADEIHGPGGLEEVLGSSDHIVLSLPLTDETRNMIGKTEFSWMREGSFFINVGRGELVDEDELIRNLQSGHLAGAGLDVFREEPLPGSSPLWSMDNVVLTPHSSVGGDPADERVVELFCENLTRFLEGGDMMNVIDKKRGY